MERSRLSYTMNPGNRIPDSFGLALVILYLFLEYVRLSFLNVLHLPMVVLVVMCIRLWLSRGFIYSSGILISFLFALFMAAHVPFATNNYWAFQTTKAVFVCTIAMSGIVAFTNNYRSLKRTFVVLNLVFLVLSIWGIARDGRVPDSAFLGDENDFALAMNIAFPFIFFSLQDAKTLVPKVFYAISLMLVGLANVVSLSRGGFIGFLPVFIYCLAKSNHKLRTLTAVTLLLGAVVLLAPPSYMAEIKSIGINTEGDTSALRIYYWKCGWKMFLDNPVFGVGSGNFPWRISEYEPPEGMHGRMHGSRPAHSLYFTLLPELGIVGVMLYGMMLWHIYKCRKRAMFVLEEFQQEGSVLENQQLIITLRRMQFMLDGAFITYFATSAFLSTLYYPYFWTLFGLAISLRFVIEKIVFHNSSLLQREALEKVLGE